MLQTQGLQWDRRPSKERERYKELKNTQYKKKKKKKKKEITKIKQSHRNHGSILLFFGGVGWGAGWVYVFCTSMRTFFQRSQERQTGKTRTTAYLKFPVES